MYKPDPQFQQLFEEAIEQVRREGHNAPERVILLASLGVLVNTFSEVSTVSKVINHNNGKRNPVKWIAAQSPGAVVGGGIVGVVLEVVRAFGGG